MNKNIVLILCGFLTMIVFAGVVSAEPSVTVEPSSAHRSEYVTLSGTGWPANQLVETNEPYFWHWKGVTGDDGNFSVQVQVPGAGDDIPCGGYGFYFYSSPISPESEIASTGFTILTGIIWTEPNSGPPGTMIKVYGNYFYDTGGRFVELDGVWKYRNKSGTPDDMMFFTMGMDFGYDDETIFYIPSDVSPGWHRITVSGADRCSDSSWTDFYVTPYDDNIPPSTAVTLSGTEGKNGWYISDVDVTLIPTDNEGGSVVNKTEYSFDNVVWITYDSPVKITAERTTTIYYRSYDYAGNIESTKIQQVNIDKNIPEIIIYAPEAEKDYLLNEVVMADWSAFDWYLDPDLVNIEILSAQATVPNGEPIDTSTIGSKTFSIEAEDEAGHKKSVTINYNVISNAEPSVTIEPFSAHRGDTVTISGTGWTPGETLSIENNNDGGYFYRWELYIHPVVKEDGTFSVAADVPKGMSQIQVGIYSFRFYNSELIEQASASFEVLPGIIWTVPSSGPPGTKIDIYGDQFDDSGGRTEFVRFDSGFLWGPDGPFDYQGCQDIVNHQGFYIESACDYYIPKDATPGLHKVIVDIDVRFGVSADFYVTPYDDNIPPSTAVTLSGTLGSHGWYISDVDVTLIPMDNEGGSGVNKTEYSFDNSIWTTYDSPIKITAIGITTVYYRSYDYAGNIESTKVQQVDINEDIEPLGIIINVPEAEKDYLLNEYVIAEWYTYDLVSGILYERGTVPSGEPIDTSTVGSKTFSVEMEDEAGNKASVTIKYNVISPSVTPTPVPEYPAIALPMVALIGLVFILYRRRISR